MFEWVVTNKVDHTLCLQLFDQATNKVTKKPAMKDQQETEIPMAAYYLALQCMVCQASWIWFHRAYHSPRCMCGAHWNNSLPAGLHLRVTAMKDQQETSASKSTTSMKTKTMKATDTMRVAANKATAMKTKTNMKVIPMKTKVTKTMKAKKWMPSRPAGPKSFCIKCGLGSGRKKETVFSAFSLPNLGITQATVDICVFRFWHSTYIRCYQGHLF